jgi:catechol 2,3-dioxygenase-like lactoylglutathione lyase family enzyme
LKLDHIIIGVHHLEQAEALFRQKLGLAVSGGGIHPSGGTANRIIVIGDTYLELIAVRIPEEAQPSMMARLMKGEGYLNVVLASDDIHADSADMAKRGVVVYGPTAGQLTSPDGRTRGWSRTDIERPDLAQRYPFLIQHDSSGQERRVRLAGWNVPPAHPLGAKKVESATIAVADLAEAALRFQHIYGLSPTPLYSAETEGWEDGTLVAFPLGTGGQSLRLAAPARDTSTDLAGNAFIPQPGGLTRHLQIFGESLCAITLIVENMLAARHFLDKQGVDYLFQEHPSVRLWISPKEACGAAILLREA